MPLSWNLTACADPAALQTDEEWPVTNTIILLMPVIGIGSITDANAPEVFARLDLVQRLNGALMYRVEDGKAQDRSLTPLDVRARIGLRCNVGPETWASFQRRMVKWVRPDAERKYREATRPPVEDGDLDEAIALADEITREGRALAATGTI